MHWVAAAARRIWSRGCRGVTVPGGAPGREHGVGGAEGSGQHRASPAPCGRARLPQVSGCESPGARGGHDGTDRGGTFVRDGGPYGGPYADTAAGGSAPLGRGVRCLLVAGCLPAVLSLRLAHSLPSQLSHCPLEQSVLP